MAIRKAFTGMLPAAITKFEELMTEASALNPTVTRGYDVSAGPDSFFGWGCACSIQCDDMEELQTAAEGLGITWLGGGDLAYTNSLTIDDFKTFRVNGALELMSEEVL